MKEAIETEWPLCDVEGCEDPASNGGLHWRNTGYWYTCFNHSHVAYKSDSQPEMKGYAVKREAQRKTKEFLKSKGIRETTYEGVRLVDEHDNYHRIVDLLEEYYQSRQK